MGDADKVEGTEIEKTQGVLREEAVGEKVTREELKTNVEHEDDEDRKIAKIKEGEVAVEAELGDADKVGGTEIEKTEGVSGVSGEEAVGKKVTREELKGNVEPEDDEDRKIEKEGEVAVGAGLGDADKVGGTEIEKTQGVLREEAVGEKVTREELKIHVVPEDDEDRKIEKIEEGEVAVGPGLGDAEKVGGTEIEKTQGVSGEEAVGEKETREELKGNVEPEDGEKEGEVAVEAELGDADKVEGTEIEKTEGVSRVLGEEAVGEKVTREELKTNVEHEGDEERTIEKIEEGEVAVGVGLGDAEKVEGTEIEKTEGVSGVSGEEAIGKKENREELKGEKREAEERKSQEEQEIEQKKSDSGESKAESAEELRRERKRIKRRR